MVLSVKRLKLNAVLARVDEFSIVMNSGQHFLICEHIETATCKMQILHIQLNI